MVNHAHGEYMHIHAQSVIASAFISLGNEAHTPPTQVHTDTDKHFVD